MLIQAAANEWKVPASECSAANSVDHAQGVRQAPPPTARSPRPRPSSTCRRTSRSRIRRTGRSPASRSSGSTPPTRSSARWIYGIDVKLPGMLNAAIKAVPGVRRQGEELRRRQDREACPASRRSCRSATTPSRSSPTRGGRPRPRSTRCRSSGTTAGNERSHSATIAEFLKEGLDGRAGLRRQPERRRQSRHRRRGQEGRGGLLPIPYQNHAPMEPMNATALVHRRQVRGLVRHAGRRSARSRPRSRHPACRPTSATCTR